MDDKTVEQIAELTKKILIKAGKPVYGDSVLDMYLNSLSEGRHAKLPGDFWIEHRIVNLNEIIVYAVTTIEQMAALAQIELPINCDKMKSERYFIQQEGTPMSDLIRQEVNSNLSLRLSSLINIFPNNDYHYEELQREIGRTILQHDTTEMSRRESVKLIVLAPVQFCLLDGIVTLSHVQTDNATLLKHIAAALAGCWYIKHHRGKEHAFIDGLAAEYIKILQGVAGSKLEAHRMAAFSLLAQSLLLRAGIVQLMNNNNAYALTLAEQALSYSVQAHDMGLEAYANRLMAQFFWDGGKYEKALERANRAKALIKYGNLDELTQSWVYSGVAYCQAFAGKSDDAVASIKQARNLFDPRLQTPTAMQFGETILWDCCGITALRNGNYKEAVSLFEQEEKIAKTPLGEAQAWLGLAKVEATHKGASERSVLHLLDKSVTRAREMGSQLFVNRAYSIYKLYASVTPDEHPKGYIKKFGEEYFPSMN